MERGRRDRGASVLFFLVGLPATLAIPTIAISLLLRTHPSGLPLSLALLLPSLSVAATALFFAAPVGIGTALFASEFLHGRPRHIVTLLLEGLGALPPVCAAWIATLLIGPWWSRLCAPAAAFSIAAPLLLALLAAVVPRIPPRTLDRLFGLPLAIVCGMLLAATASLSLNLAGTGSAWLPFPSLYSPFGAGLAIASFLAPKVAARCLAHLARVPAHLREASLTCGATRWETARRVVIPQALLPLSFVLLELLAWACGETMVVLVLCGSSAHAPWDGATLASALVLGLPDSAAGSLVESQLLWSALMLLILAVAAQIPAALQERQA